MSTDGMRMFGVMELSSGFEGCRFAIGLRNSHDKSFRLSCTVGLRVIVCENLAFHGGIYSWSANDKFEFERKIRYRV